MFWPDFRRPSWGFSTFFFLGLSTFLGFPVLGAFGAFGAFGPLEKSRFAPGPRGPWGLWAP